MSYTVTSLIQNTADVTRLTSEYHGTKKSVQVEYQIWSIDRNRNLKKRSDNSSMW